MISGGMAGQPSHGYNPIIARVILVKVLQRVMPPLARMASRVSFMCSASGSSPAIFNVR